MLIFLFRTFFFLQVLLYFYLRELVLYLHDFLIFSGFWLHLYEVHHIFILIASWFSFFTVFYFYHHELVLYLQDVLDLYQGLTFTFTRCIYIFILVHRFSFFTIFFISAFANWFFIFWMFLIFIRVLAFTFTRCLYIFFLIASWFSFFTVAFIFTIRAGSLSSGFS